MAAILNAQGNFEPHFAGYYSLLVHKFGPDRPQTLEEQYYDTYIEQSGVHHP